MQLTQEDLEKAQEIKAFLDQHYREHYKYDEIVQKFDINLSRLKIAFKAVTNDDVYAYVNRVRIRQAKILLRNTDQSIGDIAAGVGLNRTNLNILFKKSTGKTPFAWRKHPGFNFKLFSGDAEAEL